MFLFPRMWRKLDAGDILGAGALLAVNNLEIHRITDFEIGKGDAGKIIGMEEKILGLPFAGDKTETFVRQCLDCA